MPIDQVTIVRSCGHCGAEIETLAVKKDNMMLSSKALVWCELCQRECPESRDIAGRSDAIRAEQQSYPQNRPAVPFGAPPAAL